MTIKENKIPIDRKIKDSNGNNGILSFHTVCYDAFIITAKFSRYEKKYPVYGYTYLNKCFNKIYRIYQCFE